MSSNYRLVAAALLLLVLCLEKYLGSPLLPTSLHVSRPRKIGFISALSFSGAACSFILVIDYCNNGWAPARCTRAPLLALTDVATKPPNKQILMPAFSRQ